MLFDTHAALLEGVREILSTEKDLSSQTRGCRLARRNWEIGDAIHNHLLANDGKPAYGEGLFESLAEHISVDQSTVYQMLRLRRCMPNLVSIPKLTWTHYLRIIPLKTLQEREFYERAAVQAGWKASQLKQRIKDGLYTEALQIGSAAYLPEPAPASGRLSPRKGQLYTYRLIRGLPGQAAQGDVVVDLGFGSQWPERIRGIDNPRPGMIVTASKTGRGTTAQYHFTVNRTRGRKLTTVKALPERVIDGDTILVRVDQGFISWRPERLRLRGIDCSELYSKSGQLARDYVRERLDQVEFVVISAGSRDLYGRCLSDLFYLPDSDDPAEVLANGHFLNRQLLDEGLAEPYA